MGSSPLSYLIEIINAYSKHERICLAMPASESKYSA
jgi:hypothetical protein